MNDTKYDNFCSALNVWLELTGDPRTLEEYMSDTYTWDRSLWTTTDGHDGKRKQRPSRKVPAVAVEVPQEETVKPGEEE